MSSSSGNGLQPGESLAIGEFLSGPPFTLIMQSDGNLVLYGTGPHGKFAEWASGTQGSGGSTCTMGDDGNLVIYDGDNNSVWESGTSGFDGAVALVNPSGAFVIELAGGSPAIWQNGQLTGFGVPSDSSKRASRKETGHHVPPGKHSDKGAEHHRVERKHTGTAKSHENRRG